MKTPQSHQRELVDGSDPAFETTRDRANKRRDLSFMDLLREQVGSEQSTNFRWWDSYVSEAHPIAEAYPFVGWI